MIVLDNKKRPDILFRLQNYKKDEQFTIGIADDHTIVFILLGDILITTNQSEKIEFTSETMFFCSKTLSPYMAVAKEDTTLIQLNTEFVLPFMDSVRLNDIFAQYAPEPFELFSLRIEKFLRAFLSNVVYYGRNKISSGHLQDIKVKEFIFLLRSLYDHESLARFFSTLTLSQNKFKNSVLDNYTDNCSVGSLAAKCFMTTKTFTRKFKVEFRTTPHRWIIQQKTKSLEYTLTHLDKPIDEILESFHFSSLSELLLFCRKHNISSELVKNKYKR